MAERELGEMEEVIRGENSEITDQEFSQERRTRTAAKAEEWIEATVVELKELLASSIKLY